MCINDEDAYVRGLNFDTQFTWIEIDFIHCSKDNEVLKSDITCLNETETKKYWRNSLPIFMVNEKFVDF